MRIVLLAATAATGLAPALAQQWNPLVIPPLLEEDTFHLTVDEHTHQFYPGLNTTTYGVNGDHLDTGHARTDEPA